MTDTKMSLQEVVELDLFGKCTDAQEDFLHDNLDEWRDELALSLKALDHQFTTRRASMLENGSTEVKKEYTIWKAKACGRKHAICTRIQDVNAWIKERNMEAKANEHPSRDSSIVGSSANRGQMAAIILAANIEAKTKNPVKKSLAQLRALCEGLAEDN
jgi:hypothetical protein